MRHPIDIAIMFIAIWLLASMVLDVLTPKELTVYMIGAAIGPAVIITALFYYLQVPRADFAVVLSMLWLISGLTIEMMSPAVLPNYIAAITLGPVFLVGVVLHWQCYRCGYNQVIWPLARGR